MCIAVVVEDTYKFSESAFLLHVDQMSQKEGLWRGGYTDTSQVPLIRSNKAENAQEI